MPGIDPIELFQHMEWADALVWRNALALPAARDDAVLRERLYHTHVVQWTYLQMWCGVPLRYREESSFEDLEAIHAWVRDYYGQAAEQLEQVDAESLGREVEFPWAEQLIERFGRARMATLAETIVQVVSHTSYHRGQINTRLRELGGEPPLTDFIAWIWMGRPAASWSDAAANDSGQN